MSVTGNLAKGLPIGIRFKDMYRVVLYDDREKLGSWLQQFGIVAWEDNIDKRFRVKKVSPYPLPDNPDIFVYFEIEETGLPRDIKIETSMGVPQSKTDWHTLTR